MPGFLGGSSSGSGTGGEITFPKEFIDPVTKLRVSQPENLIDTDFEYGLQPTKWETVELINNTPSFFSKSGDTTIPGIVSITTNSGTREITVVTALEHGLAVGIPINVTGTKSITADGSYIINSIPNTYTFTYLCKDDQSGTNSIEDLYSSIITGEFFQGSQLRVADSEGITTDGESVSTLTVNTDSPHGFGVNTPFYFLNLNSTISQEFEAANTAAKSFDSSNSATAQTFDGSNTLSTFNIDWSNSATSGGTASTIDTVSTVNNTIKVIHSTETFAAQPLGTPLYYNVSTSAGYFATNPRGVVFLKSVDALNTPAGQSTFQVSATPDGTVISIEASMSGTFQLANQARTFAGNNINASTEVTLTVDKGTIYQFDGSNTNDLADGNVLATVSSYSGSLVNVSVTSGAGLQFYTGAMVKYSTTGSAATGLTNNTTYFVDTFLPAGGDNYSFTLKTLPGSTGTAVTSISGGTGTQTFTRIGVSVDKDIIHVRNSGFSVGDMVNYTFPTNGNFVTSENKEYYFVTTAYDSHNYQLDASAFAPITASGGVISQVVADGRTYNVHTFATVGSANFVVSSAGSEAKVEILVVGGGAAGSLDHGGGGGGGAVLYNPGFTVSATTYAITVGGGGSGADGNYQNTINGTNQSGTTSRALGNAASGGNSSFTTSFVAPGGGGGAGFGSSANGGSGGSGGGGGAVGTGTGGASTKNSYSGWLSFGNVGGASNYNWGGGGGGATVAGDGATGRGGNGVWSNISGSTQWYAGGGSGGPHAANLSSSNGPALGGGGPVPAFQNWNYRTNGAMDATYYGGGGSGTGNDGNPTYNYAGNGFQGVVIVRYPVTEPNPAPTPISATGGSLSEITVGTGGQATTYRVHTFPAGTTNFVVNSVGTLNGGRIEYLVIAGGGSGSTGDSGNDGGGGGGGGGFIEGSTTITAGTYPVVVGTGAAGINNTVRVAGNTGNNSSFNGLTAVGGGRGGQCNSAGGPGGSGGGAGGGGGAGFAGGTATSGQGNNGGYNFGGPSYTGAGGGGAGGVGNESGSGRPGGDGGFGKISAITGTAVAYSAGGGGGGGIGATSYNGGSGGSNGAAGRGGNYNDGSSGTGFGQAPTTPGSGSGGAGNRAYTTANGANGIVVIRYPISKRAGAL